MTKMLTKRLKTRCQKSNTRQQIRQTLSMSFGPSHNLTHLNANAATTTVKMYMDDPQLDDLEIIEILDTHAGRKGVKRTMKVRTKSPTHTIDEFELPKMAKMNSSGTYADSTPNLGNGPLRNFLNARLGQPIQQVEQALRRRCGKKFIYADALLHAFSKLVSKHVAIEENGSVRDLDCSTRYFPEQYPREFYVHPVSGILAKSPPQSKPEKSKLLYEQYEIDKNSKLVKLEDGLWYVLSFKPIPYFASYTDVPLTPMYGEPSLPIDVVTKQDVYGVSESGFGHSLEKVWGSKVYAASKRSANKEEIRKYRKVSVVG